MYTKQEAKLLSDLREIQLGFIGAAIIITVVELDENGLEVVVDISAATSLQIQFKKPDTARTVVVKTASKVTDGTDGKLQYITILDDLDLIGIWEVQALITHPNFTGPPTVERFKVVRNINC